MQRYAPLRSATQPTRKLRSATQHYAAHTQRTRSAHAALRSATQRYTQRYAAHTQRYAGLKNFDPPCRQHCISLSIPSRKN